MALFVAFNVTLGSTATQPLDPSGVQPVIFNVTVKALSTNTGILYVSGSSTAAANVGFPLQAGQSQTFNSSSDGLFISGTSGDKYGVIGS